MIVKMKKVFVAARADHRGRLLDALRALGVVHLEPVDPKAAAPEPLRQQLERTRRARQVLSTVAPGGPTPDLDIAEAVDETLASARRIDEGRNRLSSLAREAEALRMWGELRRSQLDELAAAGVPVAFYIVPAKDAGEVRADLAAPLLELPGKRLLLAVVQRQGQPSLPASAAAIELPRRDLPSVREEARQVDEALLADSRRLAALANLFGPLAHREHQLVAEIEYAVATAGALAGSALFAVQGWSPADEAAALQAGLGRQGLDAAVTAREPRDDESPPTLIRYPIWARPIEGLFQILGILPGYRELDLSAGFMIALPIFVGILIGDAGYGLLFVLLPAIFWRWATAKMGLRFTQLLMVFGVFTMVWGAMTGSYFGTSPAGIARWAGPAVGGALGRLQVFTVSADEHAFRRLMRLSFYIGAIHLSIAQLWRAAARWPRLTFLNKVGWAMFLWGMLGAVQHFVLGDELTWSQPYFYLLIAGAFLAIMFAAPSRNLLKAFLNGLAQFPLSAIGSFSDTLSYVRLVAVGLAGAVLASNFNELAAKAWIAAPLVLLLGHGLNIGLSMIAIFSHGVRLNVLEFSNNAGMEWSGYKYDPFSNR